MKIKLGKEDIVISDFDVIEVYKVAMKIEADGEKFYKSVIGLTKDERIKRTFKRLAEDELRHYGTFKGLLEVELRTKGIDPSSVDTEEGIFTYMDSGIFAKETEAKSMKDAVMSGEIVELRSILFYKELLKSTNNEGGKRALNEILEEEKMHYNILKSWEAAI